MNARFFLLLFVTILNFSIVYAQEELVGLPFVTTYSTRDYDGGIQNRAITQGTDGLIYVANNFGLLEFDGTNWTRRTLPIETKIRDVFVHESGRLYVASQGDFGYFEPNEQGKVVFTSLVDRLPKQYRDIDETWQIFEDHGDLYFCTFSYIFIYKQDGSVKVIDPKASLETFFFVNHTLYINQLDRGLVYLNNDRLDLVDQGDFFRDKIVSGLLPLANKQLWIATKDHGIFIYNGASYETWGNSTALAGAKINTCLRLRNGNIAIGTQNQGVLITTTEGELVQALSKGRGLQNRTVLSMYEDNLGNLWLGHNNGIAKVELTLPFTIINEQIGLPGTGYDGYLAAGHLYLGTSNGLYVKPLTTSQSNDYQLVRNTAGQVYKIQNIDQHLLLGHHEGAFTLEGKKAEKLADILGAWTFLELKAHPNYVVAGTYKGLLLFKKEGNILQFVNRIEGFAESSRVMDEDDQGVIWMSHGYKGVYRLELNDALTAVKVTHYGQEAGLPSNLLINLWRVNNRVVFTTESAIYKYSADADRFVKDEFFNEYFSEDQQISYLEQDPMGNIYYISLSEIGVLEHLANGTYQKKSRIFNRLKGLLNDDLQNLSVLDANHVLYGAQEGFLLYTKSVDNLREIAYKTLIRGVSITAAAKDSLIYEGHRLEVPSIIDYQNNSIHINFSAPFFHASQQIQYQYKLNLNENDQSWSDWTNKTDKEYTNLKEGMYTFHVRAKNIYGEMSEAAVFEFRVLPPWYRSTLAYVVYVLVAVLLLGLLMYSMELRHKRERQLMAMKQEKEITRIDSELKSSEEQVERLKNEKLKTQIEQKNKELGLSTMHLLNKNSFINSVKLSIGAIIKRSKNEEVKKELTKLMGSIDKNIASDNDWEDFAIHFDEVHGDFTRRLKEDFPKLTPQEMKLSAYLRMNLSTKEIAHLLNISVRGVEIARYRLRKKLNLERSTNLQEFILSY